MTRLHMRDNHPFVNTDGGSVVLPNLRQMARAAAVCAALMIPLCAFLMIRLGHGTRGDSDRGHTGNPTVVARTAPIGQMRLATAAVSANVVTVRAAEALSSGAAIDPDARDDDYWALHTPAAAAGAKAPAAAARPPNSVPASCLDPRTNQTKLLPLLWKPRVQRLTGMRRQPRTEDAGRIEIKLCALDVSTLRDRHADNTFPGQHVQCVYAATVHCIHVSVLIRAYVLLCPFRYTRLVALDKDAWNPDSDVGRTNAKLSGRTARIHYWCELRLRVPVPLPVSPNER